MADRYCEKCHKTMNPDQFYGSNNLEKYPEGKVNQCKKCLTMHVDNYDPRTFLWILEEVDVPYIADKWNEMLIKYGQNKKLTGMTILGRYLSQMKLNQWKDYRWKDTEYLQEQANHKIEETMKRQGFGMAEIDAVIKQGVLPTPIKPAETPFTDPQSGPSADYAFTQDVESELAADLTEEDRTYLCMTWGKQYRADEWIQLEQLYQDMMNSYDIQQAGDKNTLRLACKSSLKANQLLDIGDIDGAQKATKMYDALMKAGKWTAAQNKTEENELIDSVGELVAICERDGFIPKYYTDTPQDKADRVIQDMQIYTKDLIENESGLSVMMERAVKQIEEEEERIRAAGEAGDANDEDAMFNYEEPVFDIEDYSEFQDFQEEEMDATMALLEGADS